MRYLQTTTNTNIGTKNTNNDNKPITDKVIASSSKWHSRLTPEERSEYEVIILALY
jgi:hypothetical protein